jgi:UMF1 family MFS transporter
MKPREKLTIVAWSFYDFANTIFSMNVISLYFVLWVTLDKKAPDLFFSIALSTSMLMAAISAPLLGHFSDRYGKKMPFLMGFTAICCLATAYIGLTPSLSIGLICFVIANYCYQVADTFYNALLPLITAIKDLGRTSGFGVSLGYLGTITGLLLTSPFVIHFGRQAAFVPTAFFFFIFALPCFFLVKEPVLNNRHISQDDVVKESPKALWKLNDILKTFQTHSLLFPCLLAIFVIFNTVNTVYIFMSVYVKQVMAFSDAQLIILYLCASIFAMAGSLLGGMVVDKIGAKNTLSITMVLWMIALMGAIFVTQAYLFWGIGCMVGFCLGSTQASSRALIAQISPLEQLGKLFGFYGLVGKSASIVGPLIWGISTWIFQSLGLLKYRIAVLILLCFLIVGFLLLQRVPNIRRTAYARLS